MDPAKDEEVLFEQLYTELIGSDRNKRDRGATDEYVGAQEYKVKEAHVPALRVPRFVELRSRRRPSDLVPGERSASRQS